MKHRLYSSTILVSAVLVSALLSIACGETFITRTEDPDGQGGSAGAAASSTAGAAGATSAPQPQKDCVPDGKPDRPDDDFADTNCDGIDGDIEQAVFVAASGDDLAMGTPEDPLATLGVAISLASERGHDVYVSSDTYERPLRMQGEGVNIYGGYDAENGWQRTDQWTLIKPGDDIPLVLQSVQDVTLDRLVFEGTQAEEPEASSFAAVITDSSGLHLNRVELRAKDGGAGIAGENGRDFDTRARQGENGTSGCSFVGCDGGRGFGGNDTFTPSCPNGTNSTPGGFGGDGADSDGSPAAEDGFPSEDGVSGGQVGGPDVRDGDPGGPGAAGTDGDISTEPIGTIEGLDYVPDNVGSDGDFGENGEAGGGGAGSEEHPTGYNTCCAPGDGGGQGGYAGCGGRPATGGTAGGGSFALLLLNSELELTGARLLTGQGGDGGAGARGGDGQLGGQRGDRGSTNAGYGGRGGDGGRGGHGAPGGGGPAVGIALIQSNVPAMEDTQILPGDGGPGGEAISGSNGQEGLSVAGYNFTTRKQLSF